MQDATAKRSLKDYGVLTLKGMAMGAADVVPGVSGGTIAFIANIYSELLHSLKNIGPETVRVLFRDGIGAAWRQINGNFLLALFGGVLISLKTLATAITFALETQPILVWAFFFGLILASVVYFARQQRGWGLVQWLALLVGIGLVTLIAIAKPAELPGHWWVLFGGGFVAICAMILPGVSGSFILLLVGLYPVFLRAIEELDLVALASFGGGCIVGLLTFSRLLAWLMDHYERTTLALLIGFLAGSLQVVWPWKLTLESRLDRHGEVIPVVQENVLPATFQQQTGEPAHLALALFSAVVGILVILLIEFWANKKRSNPGLVKK
jgi:putative membrane protein